MFVFHLRNSHIKDYLLIMSLKFIFHLLPSIIKYHDRNISGNIWIYVHPIPLFAYYCFKPPSGELHSPALTRIKLWNMFFAAIVKWMKLKTIWKIHFPFFLINEQWNLIPGVSLTHMIFNFCFFTIYLTWLRSLNI